MRIDSSGNVGIGTTEPSYALHVPSGRGVFGGTPTSNPGSYLGVFGSPMVGAFTGGKFIYLYNDGTNIKLDAYNYGTSSALPVVIAQNGGNVGIGTTGPGSPLEIVKAQARTSLTGSAKGLLHLNAGPNATGEVTAITFDSYQNLGPSTIIGQRKDNNGGELFFGTSNSWGTVTNTAMFIDYSGNVGIGTTVPASKLDVRGDTWIQRGSGDNTDAWLNIASGNYASNYSGIYFGGWYAAGAYNAMYNKIRFSGGFLRISNNQQDKFIIGGGDEWGQQNVYINPTGGNVGIGTVSPSSKLELVGGAFTLGDRGDVWGSQLTLNGTGFANRWDIYNEKASGLFRLYSVGGSKEVIAATSTGNVGIGTTGPGSSLDILKTVTGASNLNTPTAGVILDRYVNGSDYRGSAIFHSYRANPGDYEYLAFAVATANSGSPLNASRVKMVIDEGGNVGIGTTGPNYRLETLQGSAGTLPGFNIAVNTTSRATIGFGLNSGVTSGWIMGQSSGNNTTKDFYLYDTSNSAFRLLVATTGNVGIGTTGPNMLLHVAKNGLGEAVRIQNSAEGITYAGLYLSPPSWTNGKPAWIRSYNNNGLELFTTTTAGSASNPRVSLVSSDSIRFLFSTADTTDPTDANWAEKVRITSTGNVGIGTTGPRSVLEVAGAGTLRITNTVANPNWYGWVLSQDSSAHLDFSYPGVTQHALYLKYDTGNVGIGTAGPG